MNLYGVWIDHAGAYILKATEEDVVSMEHIDSGVEPNHKTNESDEHVVRGNEKTDDNRRNEHMHKFAKQVIEKIKDGDEIAICGPSTAKFDLRREYEKNASLAKKVVAFEAADKMTENQLKAHLKDLLQVPREDIFRVRS